MPKLFKVGAFSIFFWSNELGEPIHVHVCVGNPYANSTKIWLTQGGGALVAHNKSRIAKHDLAEILVVIQVNFDIICKAWKEHFDIDNIEFYC